MLKRKMALLVLLALFAVPAAHAADSESNAFLQAIRDIFTRVSAMIPPTGNPTPPSPGP